MRLREEMTKALEERMELIPPFKLAEMSKTANKIVQLLADKAVPVSYGYSEMKIILKMVDNILGEGVRDNAKNQGADGRTREPAENR